MSGNRKVGKMPVTRRYTFKLYPNAAQLAALQTQAVLCARIWNAALEQREVQWAHECQRKAKGERKGLSRFDQSKELKYVRADDPAYEAMSFDTLALVIKSLDLAFQAFFKRAKGGAGKSSGYPQYKSAKRADSIPFRDMGKGWELIPFNNSFKIYAKGICDRKDQSAWIKVRGKFPSTPTDIRSMELIKRDGAWWASIVVFMEERRTAGKLPILIDMDLIDRFAEVKNASTGQCLPGLTVENYSAGEQISTQSQRDTAVPGEVSGGSGADDKEEPAPPIRIAGDVSGETLDAIQSEGDRRYKKFSYRWKKEKQRLAKLKAKQARQRAHMLHNWSAAVVKAAREIEVISPPIKDLTKSARGTQKNPGAAVETVAKVNRHILDYAPAAAIAMLEYKAAEAGTPIAVRKAGEHAAYIGQELSTAAKQVRKTRRTIQKELAA